MKKLIAVLGLTFAFNAYSTECRTESNVLYKIEPIEKALTINDETFYDIFSEEVVDSSASTHYTYMKSDEGTIAALLVNSSNDGSMHSTTLFIIKNSEIIAKATCE
jgi:hypothetical protein